MISSLISLSFFLTSQSQCEIRFTPADACKFEASAENVLAQVRDHLMASRELALQAANGSSSAVDRSYLDAEFRARKEEVGRLIQQATFTDSFQSHYNFLRDGLIFTTLVHSDVSQADFVYRTQIKSIPENLGAYARQIYALRDLSTETSGFLQINDILISKAEGADTVSYDVADRSAIALAHAINRKSGSSLVFAAAQENRVSLGKIDFNLFPLTMPVGLFRLNGISVTKGSVHGVGDLISAINDISTSTGVKALLASGTINEVDLSAIDGRNITIEVSSEVARAISLKLQSGRRNTFGGAIEVRSNRSFKILAHRFEYLGFDGVQEISLDSNATIFTSNLLTQPEAERALTPLDQSLSTINEAIASIAVLNNGCGGRL